MTDSITLKIKDWHTEFFQKMRSEAHLASLFTTFTVSLQTIMVDPFGSPLRDEIYLGNEDQPKVCGIKPLLVYLERMPEHLQGRSPFEPESEKLYVITGRHRIAEAAHQLLERCESALPHKPEILARYNELNDLEELPILPTPEMAPILARARALNLEERARDERERQSAEEAENHFRERLVTPEGGLFGRIRASAVAARDAHRAGVSLQVERDRNDLTEARARAETLRRLNQEATELNAELERENGEVLEGISRTEQNISHLEVEAESLKAAVAASKGDGESGFMTQILIGAACVGISFALPEMAPAAAKAAPIAGGGAKFSLTIPIVL